MQTAELLILLLISLAGFGLLARKLQLPEPIVLVVGGLAVSLIPGLPSDEMHLGSNHGRVFATKELLHKLEHELDLEEARLG